MMNAFPSAARLALSCTSLVASLAPSIAPGLLGSGSEVRGCRWLRDQRKP